MPRTNGVDPVKIRSFRQTAGHTLSSAARSLEVSRQTFWNWEHGVSQPPAARLKQIATLLNTTMESLML